MRRLAVLGTMAVAGTVATAPMPAPVPAPVTADGDVGRPARLAPALAAHARGALLVWQRGRLTYTERESDIEARRISTDGRPAGPVVQVSRAPGPQTRPRAACLADGRCLVVWQDLRNGRDWDVYAARIAADGRVLDPGGSPLAEGPRSQALPDVATDGTRFLVVWQHMAADGFYELRAALLRWNELPRRARTLPVRYRPRDAARWLGYTPGWGWDRRPVSPGRRESRAVLGGRPSVVAARRGWVLGWLDEASWRPGGPGWARVARLRVGTAEAVVVDPRVPPEPVSAQRPGVLATDGAHVLRCVPLVTGRGSLTRLVLGELLDARAWRWLGRPAGLPKGWKRRWPGTTPLLGGRAADGPAACAAGHGVFAVAARASAHLRPDASTGTLLVQTLAADGSRLGEVHAPGPLPGAVRDPALAATASGFLLAFAHDERGDGGWRIRLLRLDREGRP